MIDSSGRKGIRANGTILDLLPVSQVIGVIGMLLVALFTLIKPEASNGLAFKARALFWGLHVGLGLTALWVASRWLASGKRLPNSTLAAIIVTGCAGALLATPGYLALDALYAPHIVDLDPDPPTGWLLLRLLEEAIELIPWFLATWVLINLPVLLPPPDSSIRMDDTVNDPPPDNKPLAVETKQTEHTFLLCLPGIIGTDVIAVASDLHYLNVWTVAGRTTLLGNLRDVVEELDELGMQVHRSHWIANSHVRRVVGNASNAACIMSNELRVPVSRRRWKAVRDQFGRGVIHGVDSESEQQT